MNIVEYIFTAHARDRMRERNISAEEVRLVTNNPDMSYPGTKGETNNMKIIKGGITAPQGFLAGSASCGIKKSGKNRIVGIIKKNRSWCL